MNKDNKVTTKDDYKIKLIKRMLILCWASLGICFIIKIFGGNFFNIICNNNSFIKICAFIENTFLYYIVAYITYITTGYLMLLYVAPNIKYKSKQSLLFLIMASIVWGIKYCLINYIANLNPILCSIVEWIIQYLIMLLITKKKLKPLIAIVCMNTFSIISMIIRNISLTKVMADNVLITLIYMIDYYIMLELMRLYSKIKYIKEDNMGLFGWNWWLHKPLAELEAILPTLKDPKEIKACEARIAKLKAKDEKKAK